jgi:D-3-phosphoglycerate dehydrogenase
VTGRVVVTDRLIDPVWVTDELKLAGVIAELGPPEGDDVLGLLVSDSRVGPAELARLPRLRAVATCSTGWDHIDVAAVTGAGAWVLNAGDYCSDEVAEHAIALVLGLLRGTHFLDRRVREGAWELDAHPPRRVAGSTLGVVGCGRIGSRVARTASALGMRVLATDPHVSADGIRAAGAEPATLEQLLPVADVVTLHTPLEDGTAVLIGRRELAAMRPDAFLVNCARAALVDCDALGEALAAGRLAGAALDVLSREPPARDAPELQWPVTLINPHAAWYSERASEEVILRPVRDLACVLTGREPQYVVARPVQAPAR